MNPIKVIYEDEHLLAVDKEPGLASVPAENIPEHRTVQGQVRAWASTHGKDYKPYLLNRLDKDSSGVILFGKFPRDREKLEGIFRQDGTKKTYLALVKGTPKPQEGTIRFQLEARTVDKKIPAVTHYKIVKKMGFTSVLEVVIETGRKHQIRKHLAKIGHPLVLDHDYGDTHFNRNYQRVVKGKGRFFLHSWKFEFEHPFTGERLEIVAETELP